MASKFEKKIAAYQKAYDERKELTPEQQSAMDTLIQQGHIQTRPAVSPLAEHSQDFRTSDMGLMDALAQGYENLGPSFSRMGRGMMDAIQNYDKTLPALANAGAGAIQEYIPGVLEQSLAGGGEDLRPQGRQAVQAAIEPYTSYENLLETVATDPARPITDLFTSLLGGAPTAVLDKTVDATTKTFPLVLMEHALSGNNRITRKGLNQAAKDMLANGTTVSRKGLEKLRKTGSSIGNDIDDIITKLANKDGMVDMEEVARRVTARGVEKAGAPGLATEQAVYSKIADEMLEWTIDRVPEVSQTNSFIIPVKAAQEYKKIYNQRLKNFYDDIQAGQGGNIRDKSEAFGEARKAMSDEQIRLAKEAGIDNLDDLFNSYSRTKIQENLVDNVVNARFKEQWVPSDVTIPLAVELAAKGKPGVATAIGTTRRVANVGESYVANWLNQINAPTKIGGTGTSGAVESGLFLSYLNYIKDKTKDK